MEVGPVRALENLAGGKVCALASRVEVHDYADTARMLDRYSPAQLIGFARLDPGLTAEDFADAARQLDRIADKEFSRYGSSQQDVAALRAKFAAWPCTSTGRQLGSSCERAPASRYCAEYPSGSARENPELGKYALNIGTNDARAHRRRGRSTARSL
jgi:hypothetical protein